MSELEFKVIDIAPDPYAAAPMLMARLQIEETTGAMVHAIALRCQVRIEPQRRSYEPAEVEGLTDLFGERHRWSSTLKPFLWMHAAAMVKGFTDAIEIELPMPCTYDFEVAATKYLHAIREGEVPLVLMFSGTVFTRGATNFQVEQIPWHKDIEFKMPAKVWREVMDAYFPNSGWIRVPRETLSALQKFKSDRGLPTWEELFATMLNEVARQTNGAGSPL